jgi:hypothetical protein
MLKSNLAINGWRAIKSEYRQIGQDLLRTWRAEAPLTYAFRTEQARQAYDKVGNIAAFKEKGGFGPGTWDWKRIGIIGGTAYAGIDGAYRAISGGSMYRNRRGESDLVGIPLI